MEGEDEGGRWRGGRGWKVRMDGGGWREVEGEGGRWRVRVRVRVEGEGGRWRVRVEAAEVKLGESEHVTFTYPFSTLIKIQAYIHFCHVCLSPLSSVSLFLPSTSGLSCRVA